jgi:hypothetical protein
MSEFNRRDAEPGRSGESSPASKAPGGKAGRRAGVIGGLIVLVILIAIFVWYDSNDRKSGGAGLISEGESALVAPLTDGKHPAKPSAAHIEQPDQPAASNPNPQPFTPPSVPPQAGTQPAGPAQSGSAEQQNTFNPNGLPAVPGPAAAAGPQMTAKVYHARHKEGLGGGPWGQLTLSASGIQFEGEDEHYNFPLDSIGGQNADGFILKTGEKYHFRMDGLSKDQVAAEFSAWFQQIGQLKAGQALARTPH